MLAVILAAPSAAAVIEGQCVSGTAAWPGRLSLQHENDFFNHTDRDYTSGVMMTLHSGELSGRLADHCATLWFRGATVFFNRWFDSSLQNRVQALALGQQLFTPTVNGASEIVRNERPYAGWLFGRLALHAQSELRSQTIALEVGMLGPIAQGERSQNFFHSLEGYPRFQGWRNQLRNELGVQLYRENRVAVWRSADRGTNLAGHYGFALGNIHSYLNGGARLHFGGDPYSGTRAATTMHATAPLSTERLQVFTGFDVRAVARNAFLDGNSFQDSYRISHKPAVADVTVGLSGNLFGADVSYVHTWRTREYIGQSYSQRFGSVTVSFAL